MGPIEEARAIARDKFWTAAQSGIYKVLETAPTTWNSRDARFYRTEKKIIMENMDPLYWGFVVTGFLFVTFRVSGSKTWTRFRDEHIFNKPVSLLKQQAETQQKWIGHLERERLKKQELWENLNSVRNDILLSIVCGISSVILLAKPQKLHGDFSTSPLVPGRSLIHELVCPALTEEYDTVDQRVFEEIGQDDETLKTFDTFVKNCKLRSNAIASREKANEARPDVIPYPGIMGTPRD